MAEKKEKDMFWIWIGGLIVVTIILVLTLKSRETEHLQSGAVAQSAADVTADLKARRAKTGNIAVE